jgi:hypothetical protein
VSAVALDSEHQHKRTASSSTRTAQAPDLDKCDLGRDAAWHIRSWSISPTSRLTLDFMTDPQAAGAPRQV